jgi:hypothetical protein
MQSDDCFLYVGKKVTQRTTEVLQRAMEKKM